MTKNKFTPKVDTVFAEYQPTTQLTAFWRAGDEHRFEVDFTVEEMECLKDLCNQYATWAEVRIEKPQAEQLIVVWKIPASFAIRIEEPHGTFSGVFYDYRMCDLALVLEAQKDVKARGHGTTETDLWTIPRLD